MMFFSTLSLFPQKSVVLLVKTKTIMPIIVKEYTWRQTPSTLNIRIPLNPVSREKIDLFTTDSYIKAHYSPFLFEIFLLHDVDNDKSKCVVNDDEIVFDLIKRQEVEWESLEKELTKPEKMSLKQEILEKCQKKAQEESEEKRIRKSQMDRFTVQQAMKIDTKQHNLMDSRRDEQRKVAMDALEKWRVNADKKGGVKIVELPDETPEVKQTEGKRPEVKLEGKTEPKITDIAKQPRPRKPVKTPVTSEYVTKKREEVESRVLPRLRAAGTVEVSHTPRSFPTPSRESAAAEEQAWLRNVTLARRATGFVSEDLRPEEQDPQWCKEKGDEFFRAGNFLGAISAYTHGITLSDRLPSLFANRAATHFALGNFNKCVNDCSSALELMQPACEGNRRGRAKCIARRAAGLARLGFLSKAIDEMKAASKLLPDDEKIKKDVYDMERAWEQNPDSE